MASLAWLGPHLWWMTVFSLKNLDDVSSDHARISTIVVTGKSGPKIFLPKNLFFNLFLTQNTYKNFKNHDKPIHDLKKLKHHPKNKINSKPKINSNSDMFFTNFKVKKAFNMNCLYQKKSFDTNNHFDSLNWCQRHVYLSTTRIRDLSSLNQRLKNKKINFCTKIKFKKY